MGPRPVCFSFQAGWRLSQLKLKRKWLFPASCSFFFLLSLLMTGCFLWQYYLPKLKTGECSSPLEFLPTHVVLVGFELPLLIGGLGDAHNLH